MSFNADLLLENTSSSMPNLNDLDLDEWLPKAEENQVPDVRHVEEKLPNDNMDGVESISNEEDAAADNYLADVALKQDKKEINIISNRILRKASSPTELRKWLSKPVIKKRVISVDNEVKPKKQKKIVPLVREVSVVAVDSEPSTSSSLAIQPAPTTSVRPPRPASPVIEVDLTTPTPPRPLSPVFQRSTHKRTANIRKAASPPSSQPNWDDEDFTNSQKDAFSSAFVAHRIMLGCYKNADSAVRFRERRVKQLESALAVERETLSHEIQVREKCRTKLKLIGGTFTFKGDHEDSSVV